MRRKFVALSVIAVVFFCGAVSIINHGAEPGPTATPAPPTATAVPTETPTPRPTWTLQERLLDAIAEELGPGARPGVDRIAECTIFPGGEIAVGWGINAATPAAPEIDIRHILEAIDGFGIDYSSVRVWGTFAMVDLYGNAREKTVVTATYSRATIDKISWDNFRNRNVYAIADKYSVHPEFQR